jgi:hypothetical protein
LFRQNLKAAQILGDDIVDGVMRYYWRHSRVARMPRRSVMAVDVRCGGGSASRWRAT